MTSPDFEVPVPKDLLPKGGACLQAVALSSGSDWFVLTTRHEVERSRMLQTTLVSWTSTLRSLLEHLEGSCVASLQWMRPSVDLRGWELFSVTEVWAPAEEEQAETGPLIFKASAVDWLVGERGTPVAENMVGRRRLVEVQA